MRMKLADQPACGILESLVARLVLENKLEGLPILLHALRYLNGTAIISCWAPVPIPGRRGSEQLA